MKKRLFFVFALIILALFINLAVSQTPTPAPSVTPTPIPTPTPTPIPSPSVTPTPFVSPTPVSTPTSTPTTTPIIEPSPTPKEPKISFFDNIDETYTPISQNSEITLESENQNQETQDLINKPVKKVLNINEQETGKTLAFIETTEVNGKIQRLDIRFEW